ncbi:RHS repeat-associated core domain-containing protein [Streptomyces cyaneofuscatus]|uniref:RHS repeat-associated core domain-containing protein n=1 Tax=Streptomyces cyaneofuscatus TaxID=66883 RepID=UPI00386F822A
MGPGNLYPPGLHHFAARYYDPNIGRFTTPDPSGQEKNPYLYASWGDVAGAVTGEGVSVHCASAVVAAPLTLGASLGLAAGCYAAGWAVSQISQIPFN